MSKRPDKHDDSDGENPQKIPDLKSLIAKNLKTPGVLVDGLSLVDKSWIINDAIIQIDIDNLASIQKYFAKLWAKTQRYPLDQMLGPILSRFGCKTVEALDAHCQKLLQDQSEHLSSEIKEYLALLQQQEEEEKIATLRKQEGDTPAMRKISGDYTNKNINIISVLFWKIAQKKRESKPMTIDDIKTMIKEEHARSLQSLSEYYDYITTNDIWWTGEDDAKMLKEFFEQHPDYQYTIESLVTRVRQWNYKNISELVGIYNTLVKYVWWPWKYFAIVKVADISKNVKE
jgi:hypothetical protein